MADASDTSPYILAAADGSLPNSRTLLASGGLVLQDTGAAGTLTVNTSGNLGDLSSYNSPGFLVCDTSAGITFVSRELITGDGIAITAASGQVTNPTISVVPGSTVQQVNVLATGVQISTQPNLNFIGDGAVSVTVGDYALGTMANITISAPVSASTTSTYILQTPDGSLPNSQPLSPLDTGILKVTTGTGVLSTAVPNTDYQAASDNLTGIANITSPPPVGTLIVGTGDEDCFEAFPTSPNTGYVLTNNAGALPSWEAPATGNLVEVLPDPTTSQALGGKTTYIARNSSGGRTIFTLPSTPTPGDFYQILCVGNQGWQVNQNAGQQIIIGPAATTTGTGGNLQSTLTTGPGNDSIIIWCVTSTQFIGIPLTGEINVT